MKYLLVIAVLLSFTVPAGAQPVRFHTGHDCGQWLEQREQWTESITDEHGNLLRKSFVLEQRLTSLIDGLVMASAINFWNGITPDQVHYWMDNYCRENPLRGVLNGTWKLFQERTGYKGP